MNVCLVQSALPSYRRAFLQEFRRQVAAEFAVYAGDAMFELTVRSDPSLGFERLRNVYFAGRRLLWQRGALSPSIRADVAILELNPRILNVWVAMVVRRLLRRPTILWGHVWPRRGRGSRTDRVRGLLRRSADVVVAYTETEADEAQETLRARVLAAPNAICAASEMRPAPPAAPRFFIYVGRLVKEKRPSLLLEAFAQAAPELGEMRLLFVGDGPDRPRLEARTRDLGLEELVEFAGALTDVTVLRRLYGKTLASVSPGYVGLSLIQSLGFGVPMVLADQEPHSPEIEAAVEGVTARFFAAGSAEALAETLIRVFHERSDWLGRRTAISRWCRQRYSAEGMAAIFVEALEFASRQTERSASTRRGRDGKVDR